MDDSSNRTRKDVRSPMHSAHALDRYASRERQRSARVEMNVTKDLKGDSTPGGGILAESCHQSCHGGKWGPI